MDKRFRALRLLATLYRILAWVALVGGFLLAIVIVIVGAIQARAGEPSPLLADVPFLGEASGLVPALVLGIIVVLFSLVHFVLLYATSQAIHLGLAIEHNTRETAFYLSGENLIPPPPVAESWQNPEELPSADT